VPGGIQVKFNQFKVLSARESQQSKHEVAESSQSAHDQSQSSHFFVTLLRKKCSVQPITVSSTHVPVAISATGVGLRGSHSRQNAGLVEHLTQFVAVHGYEV